MKLVVAFPNFANGPKSNGKVLKQPTNVTAAREVLRKISGIYFIEDRKI
jgi:hypothetical protein